MARDPQSRPGRRPPGGPPGAWRPGGGARRGREPCHRGLRLTPSVSTFSGRVYRQTGVGIPALPPSRSAPAPARWHRAGQGWPLYASLEAATAWAEWRAATGGAIDAADETRRLWTLDVEQLPVVDLRDAATREALGIDLATLTGTWDAPQALAARLGALGAQGAIVPSAARPDAWNLVVFPAGFGHVTVRRGRTMHPAPPA